MQARLNACACAIVPAFSSSSQLSPTSVWIPIPGMITETVEKILATSTYFDSSPYWGRSHRLCESGECPTRTHSCPPPGGRRTQRPRRPKVAACLELAGGEPSVGRGARGGPGGPLPWAGGLL